MEEIQIERSKCPLPVYCVSESKHEVYKMLSTYCVDTGVGVHWAKSLRGLNMYLGKGKKNKELPPFLVILQIEHCTLQYVKKDAPHLFVIEYVLDKFKKHRLIPPVILVWYDGRSTKFKHACHEAGADLFATSKEILSDEGFICALQEASDIFHERYITYIRWGVLLHDEIQRSQSGE
jgi:hypothetical protein